jgi:hypothetical protein
VTHEILERMRIASEQSKEHAREEGILIARDSLTEVKDVIAGVSGFCAIRKRPVRSAVVFEVLEQFRDGKIEVATGSIVDSCYQGLPTSPLGFGLGAFTSVNR